MGFFYLYFLPQGNEGLINQLCKSTSSILHSKEQFLMCVVVPSPRGIYEWIKVKLVKTYDHRRMGSFIRGGGGQRDEFARIFIAYICPKCIINFARNIDKYPFAGHQNKSSTLICHKYRIGLYSFKIGCCGPLSLLKVWCDLVGVGSVDCILSAPSTLAEQVSSLSTSKPTSDSLGPLSRDFFCDLVNRDFRIITVYLSEIAVTICFFRIFIRRC